MFFRISLVKHVRHFSKSLRVTPISSSMKLRNNKWLNTDVQARIDPPKTPLLKVTTGKTEETHIIKNKMHQNPVSATYETHNLKVQKFENGEPEEFLQMMKDFRTGIDGTGTNSASVKIQFLCTMLYGEPLREFDVIANQVGSTINAHLKQIKEGLLGYLFPLNMINKQKRATRRATSKPRDLQFKRFAARLAKLNNYLPLLPGLSVAEKMDPE